MDKVEPWGVVILAGGGVQVAREATGWVLDTFRRLEDAMAEVTRLNAAAQAPPFVKRGDVVTIHRGERRYEVLEVQVDESFDMTKGGEPMDHTMAHVSPCDPGDGRGDQWVHLDLVHLVRPAATLHAVEVNGFLVSDELVALGHHSVVETEPRRVVFLPMAGGGTDVMLVRPEYPRGHAWGREREPVATLYPGDSVKVERPSGNYTYRWMPDFDDQDSRLQLVIS